jgi:hypothetical protein
MNLTSRTKTLFFVLAVAVVLWLAFGAKYAFADAPDNRPPDNRPPDRTGDVTVGVEVGGATSASESSSVASAASESVSTSSSQSVSEATGGNASATGGNASVVNNVSLLGSTGGEAGSQSADSGGNILSPQMSVNVQGQKYRNTPSMVAPDVFPTVSCFKGQSFGLAVPGAGGSWGGGKIDEECTKREEIRIAGQLGWTNLALFRWCGLPNNVEEFGSREACLAYAAPEPEPTFGYAAEELAEFVTEPELQAADAAIIEQVEGRVAEVNDALERIEQRLDANAAAARRAQQEREQWKAELATKYLGE